MPDAENSTATTAENEQPTGGGVQGSATQPEARFTQADLDRIAGDTRKSAKEKAVADLLKELEFEDAGSLKTLVADAKKRKADEMSESEKANAETAKEKAKREEVEAKLAALETERKRDKVGAAFRTEVGKANAKNVDRVVSLLFPDSADLTAYMGDDGKINDAAIKKAVAELQKSDAYMFGTGNPGSPSLAGGRPSTPGTDRKPGDKKLFSL